MNRTIWKYTLEIVDSQTIEVPGGSELLSVIEQNNELVLYALVNPSIPTQSFNVQIKGTGHPVDSTLLLNYYFFGTVSTRNGSLVWHIFIERKALLGPLLPYVK